LRRAQDQIEQSARLAKEQADERATQSDNEKIEAVRVAQENSRAEALNIHRGEVRAHRERLAARASRGIKISIQLAIAVALGISSILLALDYWKPESYIKTSVIIALAVVIAFDVLEITGWKVVSRPLQLLEKSMAQTFMNLLGKSGRDSTNSPKRQEPTVEIRSNPRPPLSKG
jgi:hypothetical protein